jgi:signal transduction histidine kinase
MTEPGGAQRSKTFQRRITLALAALATIAALQGGFAIWAVGLAQHHVLRGRVAADIKQGFTSLWLDKQQLRNWLAQRQFGVEGADAQRDALLQRMRNTLDKLDGLAEQATALDDGAAARQRQAQRRDALTVMRGSLDQLGRGLASLNKPAPGLDTSSAWRIANELFDNAEGRDLRSLLSDSLAREDIALREKRADTDESLSWLRQLWAGTTIAFVLAALVIAGGFGRALRKPLFALAEGAAALRAGRLSHRIALEGANEFGDAARSMNAMAEELAAHRAREAQARQALEEQVARRTTELTIALNTQKEAEARRRQLFADISHELRTPTTAIRGEAQVALRGGEKPTEDYRQSLRRIEDTTRQLGATIDDLLTMARADIDSLSLRHKPIYLGPVLDEAVSLGTAMAKSQGVRIDAEPWPDGLAMLGDADRLRQLFLAVINNAIRYSHSGDAVTLAARRSMGARPAIEVSIRDQGIGIAPDDLPHIFERGFRSQIAKNHAPDGSGLGLSIARMLARGHGGDIALRCPPEGGTIATVTLPLTPSGETP